MMSLFYVYASMNLSSCKKKKKYVCNTLETSAQLSQRGKQKKNFSLFSSYTTHH